MRKTVDIYKVQGYWNNAAHYCLTPETAAAKVVQLMDKADRPLLNVTAVAEAIGRLKMNSNKTFLKHTVTKRRAS
jgi:hypothetical protein